MKTLGGTQSSDEASTFLKWVESGVFDALNRGFLERSVLVVTTESGATFEAWSLSIVRTRYKIANVLGQIALTRNPVLADVVHRREWKRVPHSEHECSEWQEKPEVLCALLRPLCKHLTPLSQLFMVGSLKGVLPTKTSVMRASQLMMRNLMAMIGCLPRVPERHYITMRVLYRDEMTPPDYEPTGFSAAPNEGGLLKFESKPLQVDIGPYIDTRHHMFHMSVMTEAETDGARSPAGLCEGVGGRWNLDLSKLNDSDEMSLDSVKDIDEEDIDSLEELYEKCANLIEEQEDGTLITK